MNFQELMQRMVNLDRPVTEEDKADKDYDGDGEVESGKDEYMGSRMKAAFPKDKKSEKEVDEAFIDECGTDMPSGMMGMRNPGQQDSISANISMNASGTGGIRDLMGILKNIENADSDMGDPEVIIKKMSHPGLDQHDDEGPGQSIIGQEELANAPDEMYLPHDFNAGSDLNRPKQAYPRVQPGDNAMAEALVIKLSSLYEEIKSRDSNTALNEFDVKLAQPTNAGFNSMFGANISGTPEVKAIIKTMKPEDYVETNKFKQEYPSADTYLEKNKWRDVVMGRQNQDMYNFVQRYNRDNNNLSIAQWLEKAKNSIKGAVTGQPSEPVSYDAARFDPTTAKTHGYGMDTTKPEKEFPMKESNEIVKLSKMLNG